jgi:hypothetical protein
MQGWGNLLAGIAGGFGQTALQLQREERNREDREKALRLHTLQTALNNPDLKPEARELIFSDLVTLIGGGKGKNGGQMAEVLKGIAGRVGEAEANAAPKQPAAPHGTAAMETAEATGGAADGFEPMPTRPTLGDVPSVPRLFYTPEEKQTMALEQAKRVKQAELEVQEPFKDKEAARELRNREAIQNLINRGRIAEIGAKTEAEMSTWRSLPAATAEALGIPADEKVSPEDFRSFITTHARLLETRAGREQNEQLRRDLATQANDLRREIAAMRSEGKSDTQQAIEVAAQSLAQGDLTNLRDISSFRGDQRLLIFKRAKELNPQFSTSEIARKIKMEDYYANGKGADNLRSFGIFLEHAGEASDAVGAIRLSQSPAINKPLNWWRKNASGSPELMNLMAALEPVRKEFESFLLGGRALYADDRKHAETILSDESSPAQIEAALKRMGHTAKARLTEENFRYKKLMGRDLPDAVSPEAMRGASKIGIDLQPDTLKPVPRVSGPAGDAGTQPAAQKIKVWDEKLQRFVER